MAKKNMRIEKDSMGDVNVPDKAYYGAQTQRAIDNFKISNLQFSKSFINSLAIIKRSAAIANYKLDKLDSKISKAITQACDEILDGNFNDQFKVDVFQTGSGTSSNMNINEVVANRASEILGGKLGSREPVHPNDHVNLGQSSNDVIPSAIHISVYMDITNKLLPSLTKLEKSLLDKKKQFDSIIKIGRTHLQDATPISLGQEFSGYVYQIKKSINRIQDAQKSLLDLALGGTAVGTGINTHAKFGLTIADEISKYTNCDFSESKNHFESQATQDSIVHLSGSLKTLSVSLHKIANDIRWLASGPRSGIGELTLPAVQPGSSIMPGKVNPVICESLIQVCAKVIGNDSAITLGGLGGFFELNVMLPLVAYSTLESIDLLSNGVDMFREKLIEGLSANEKVCENYIEGSLAMCTSLAPVIGYDKAAHLAHLAFDSGKTVREVALEEQVLSKNELEKLLDPKNMIKTE
jgi:fumarate hydratase class II